MKVAIIGAGVAGMCAAIRLKEVGGKSITEVVVIEKEDRPGGLLQSTYHDGYWWDNGAFKFGRNNYLAKLLPDAFEPFDGYNLQVWRNGRLQNFPFSLKSMLSQLSVFTLLKFSTTYMINTVKCGFGAGKTTLEHWLQCRLTPTFLELSGLRVYIRKIQGLPMDKISFLFGEQRLHYLHKMTRPVNILKTIAGLSGKKKSDGTRWLYPRESGVGSISAKLEKYAQRAGIKFHYGSAVAKISSKGQSGLDIEYDEQGRSKIYRADYVISSMPINDLAAVYENGLGPITVKELRALRFMDLQMVFFVVKKPLILSKYATLYSFENHHRWKRLVARSMPDGTTSVLVETTFDSDREEVDPNLLDHVTRDLTEELRLFRADEIVCRKTVHVPKAYPVYAVGYEKLIAALIDKLESDRLLTVGRNGRFFYSSTPKIIMQAKDTVDHLFHKITEKKHRDRI